MGVNITPIFYKYFVIMLLYLTNNMKHIVISYYVMEQKLIKLTQWIVKLTFKHLSKPQQKLMPQVIVALFQVRSFTLRDISSLIYGDVNVKHKLKKLKYFFRWVRTGLSVLESICKNYFLFTIFSIR